MCYTRIYHAFATRTLALIKWYTSHLLSLHVFIRLKISRNIIPHYFTVVPNFRRKNKKGFWILIKEGKAPARYWSSNSVTRVS